MSKMSISIPSTLFAECCRPSGHRRKSNAGRGAQAILRRPEAIRRQLMWRFSYPKFAWSGCPGSPASASRVSNRSELRPPFRVQERGLAWRCLWRAATSLRPGDYARSDSASCSGTDAMLQLHSSFCCCTCKNSFSVGSVIDPRRELCAEASSGK
jgi:hypothetical protein